MPVRITLMTWNIHKCRGSDGRCDPGRVLDVIAGLSPDVAVLQETDRKFGTKRGILDPDEVKRVTGMNLYTAGRHPGGAVGWRGNAILLREGIRCVSLKEMSLPSLEPRGAALWTLEAEGTAFEVVGMHLGLVSAWRQLQVISIAAEIASRPPVPTIVAGDSNDWRWKSRAMLPLEYVLDTKGHRPRTFPASKPLLPMDRVLAGRGAAVERLATASAARASDHLPLVSEVVLAA